VEHRHVSRDRDDTDHERSLEVIEETVMSLLRRRADAPSVAEPAGPSDIPADPPRRLSRAERKAQKAEQAAAAELAARIARAQRRLAQATGPLPVVPPRRSSDEALPAD
jgi:hypothetical protein